MGRPAKPTALKRAQGNPGKRKLPEEPREAAEVEEPAPKLATPDFLSKPAGVRWRALAPELQRMKFLTATDRDAFARYCEHLADFWAMTRTLRKEGRVYWSKSAHGKFRRRHPLCEERRRTELTLQALEDRFGLNPRARYQILQALMNHPSSPRLPLEGDDAAQPDEAPARPNSPIGALSGSTRVH